MVSSGGNVQIHTHTHPHVGDDPQCDGGYVESVGEKVQDVPHVVDVFHGALVPQLFDLTPHQTCQGKAG